MRIEEFREVVQRLERDAWAGGDGHEPFIVSIAVSTKRIADSLAEIAAALCNPVVTITHEPKPLTIPMRAFNRAAGGHARAAKLSPERRSEIARNAAKARWAKE